MAAGTPGKPNKSMGQLISGIYSKGGLRAFWIGNGANCLQVGPESALLFLLNDMLKPKIAADPHNMTTSERFICGATAGAMAMTLVYPLYTVQNRLLVAPSGFYTSILDVFRKTHAEGGIMAFASGYNVSLIRIIPYKGIDLAGYSSLRDYFCPDGKIGVFQSLGFGSLASAISQTVTHPLLVARTRLQCQGVAGRPIEYDGMLDVLKKTYQKGGARALMGGWIPSMAKNVPAVAVTTSAFVSYMACQCIIPFILPCSSS